MEETVRVSSRSSAMISEIISLGGGSRAEVIEKALEAYRRMERLKRFNKDYSRLKSNQADLNDELEDRKGLEGTTYDEF